MRLISAFLVVLSAMAWTASVKAQGLVPNAGQPRSCEGRQAAGVGTVYFPRVELPFRNTQALRPRRHIIAIAPDGALRFDGRAISPSALDARLDAVLHASPLEIGIAPARLAPAADVIAVIESLNRHKTCSFFLVGSERFDSVFDRKVLTNGQFDGPELRPFAKVTDTLIYVTHDPRARSSGKQHGAMETGCRAFFNTIEVNSDGLTNRTFKRIDTIAKLWMGVDDDKRGEIFPPVLYGRSALSRDEISDRYLAPPDIFLNGAIYTKGTTPWMCVAGAVWAVQIAGNANADLIVSP